MPLSKLLTSFSGRVPRTTFWYFALAYLGLRLVFLLIEQAMDASSSQIMELVFVLITIVPLLAVSIKRCHDLGHSGWYLLLGLIPVLGLLWLLLQFAIKEGTIGENKYGPDPLEAVAA